MQILILEQKKDTSYNVYTVESQNIICGGVAQ